MSRKLVHRERIASQSNRFHVSYSFVYDGYFAYVRYPAWWIRLFGWMVKLAGKLPYERINHVPFDDEHKAWKALEEHCLRHDDWHGVGYARAMRKELCYLDGRDYHDTGLIGMNGMWRDGPRWINDLYLTPDKPKIEKPFANPCFVRYLREVDIHGFHTYEVVMRGKWEDVFGPDTVYGPVRVEPDKVFEPGQLASAVQPPPDIFDNIITKSDGGAEPKLQPGDTNYITKSGFARRNTTRGPRP